MEESHNILQPDDLPMSVEFNNNIESSKWKDFDLFGKTISGVVMPCNSMNTPETQDPNQSEDCKIVNISPCYVTAISSYKYETFKLSTAHVTRGVSDQCRLAQMKANSKLKRSRKPYQLSNRCLSSPKTYHKRTCSSASGECESSNELRTQVMTRSKSNRVVSLFDDWPSPQPKLCSDIHRSRSLEDLRSLAKTTTVMFNSFHNHCDKELDDVSDVLSKLQFNEKGRSQS
ncbi:uncharacterized protein [Watersipora subatra]|uniref:uncharacterized protein n=1 Tax=Watersipora subatra TaxID=2589382 RepID=UPI00355C7875